MIDTHCHLTFPDYAGRLSTVLSDAAAAGVTDCISISTTTRDCLDALALAKLYRNVWCTAGVHPLYSDKTPHEWANLRTVARDPKCVAWGELGLDNHYDRPAKPVQLAVLEEQLAFIETCRPEIELPVEVHCREAFAELIPILKRSSIPASRFVFHCFTGGPDDMRLIVEFGGWASFTGVLTYKNAQAVREAAKLLPIDRVMVETDAPFLSPEPHRSVRPNEPRLVPLVAQSLAKVHGVPFDEMHSILNANTERFFTKLRPTRV